MRRACRSIAVLERLRSRHALRRTLLGRSRAAVAARGGYAAARRTTIIIRRWKYRRARWRSPYQVLSCGQDACSTRSGGAACGEGKAQETSQAGRPTCYRGTRDVAQAVRPDEGVSPTQGYSCAVRRLTDISRLVESSSPTTRPRACASRRRYGIGRRNRAGFGHAGARVARQRRGESPTKHLLSRMAAARRHWAKQARLYRRRQAIGGGVWFDGPIQSRVHRRRRHRVHALSRTDFRRHTRPVCAALSRSNPPADPRSRRAAYVFSPITTSSARTPAAARGRTALASRAARSRCRYRRWRGRQRRLAEEKGMNGDEADRREDAVDVDLSDASADQQPSAPLERRRPWDRQTRRRRRGRYRACGDGSAPAVRQGSPRGLAKAARAAES